MIDLKAVIDQLRPTYTDRVTILYAIEKNNVGRVCREWIPVPDPCDASETMSDLPSLFLYKPSEKKEEEIIYNAIVDFPEYYDFLTETMRIEHNGRQWEIAHSQNDNNVAMRVWLSDVVR